MIGIFLINSEQELAFAQFGQHIRIDGFRYVVDANICMFQHAGGEEMFTREQPAELVQLLKVSDEVLVAHIDDAGRTIDEYTVPLSRT